MASDPEAWTQMTDSEAVSVGFICPITQDMMKDPVMADDGHTYERAASSPLRSRYFSCVIMLSF